MSNLKKLVKKAKQAIADCEAATKAAKDMLSAHSVAAAPAATAAAPDPDPLPEDDAGVNSEEAQGAGADTSVTGYSVPFST